MRVDLFDFELPDDLIALRPAEPRESARLLHVRPAGDFHDRFVKDLPSLLRTGDALVVNDTKVLPAQLVGERQRGGDTARVSATLHRRTAPDEWLAFVQGAKKLRAGDAVVFSRNDRTLSARVRGREADGSVRLRFDLGDETMEMALERVGSMPLPPYIARRREQDGEDRHDYQTAFADRPGAVAAPTAGLHLTDGLMRVLLEKGVEVVRLTLHVGAGTFLPVKVADTDAHVMHSEWCELSVEAADTLNRVRSANGRVVACGTTSLRTLESVHRGKSAFEPFSGETDIFITPGYRFRAVDGLLTNFHLPRSTLFMLVAAFCGLERMKAAYEHAIKQRYRFYSYGDASLLWQPETFGTAEA